MTYTLPRNFPLASSCLSLTFSTLRKAFTRSAHSGKVDRKRPGVECFALWALQGHPTCTRMEPQTDLPNTLNVSLTVASVLDTGNVFCVTQEPWSAMFSAEQKS